MNRSNLMYGIIGARLGGIVFVLIIILLNVNINPNVILTSKDLEKGVGYQICTSSVNTENIYCKEKNVVMQTYNRTQEEIDSFINDCPNWEISKGTYCIGERLEVRGK